MAACTYHKTSLHKIQPLNATSHVESIIIIIIIMVHKKKFGWKMPAEKLPKRFWSYCMYLAMTYGWKPSVCAWSICCISRTFSPNDCQTGIENSKQTKFGDKDQTKKYTFNSSNSNITKHQTWATANAKKEDEKVKKLDSLCICERKNLCSS